MPIITVASTKGGVGKTTLAVNLALTLNASNISAALLDADKQNSASQWSQVREAMREAGAPIPSLFVVAAQGPALLELAVDKSSQNEWVLIDSAGTDSKSTREALLRSDLVLTTAAPSPVELWQVETLLRLVAQLSEAQRRRVPVALVFNRVPTHPSVKPIEEARNFLLDAPLQPHYVCTSVVKDRVAFQHSFREGKGVHEYLPADLNARQEIEALTNELIRFFNNNSTINGEL